ncbi:hypothetical protein FRC17_002457 [Serendipita sp. 399]|nr:hypothetical protein FRC17_002457 [Serendipita sp. 399]
MALPNPNGPPSDLGSSPYPPFSSQLATNHVQQSPQQLENTSTSVHPYVFASAARRQASNSSAPAQSSPSNSQAKMMGSSIPWNPNNNPVPDYPNPDALAAGYQAFLDSYTTKGGQDNPAKSTFQTQRTGFHEGNDFEARNSTSNALGYGQHHYASPEGYPSSNAMAHPHQHISNGGTNAQKDVHARHQQQPPQRQSTTSSGDMFALSPESFASSQDSPQLFGHGLTTSPPLLHQTQQYVSPDPQLYYSQQPYPNQAWQHPQTASAHVDNFQFQPHFQPQQQLQSTYAQHAPAPGGNGNYGQIGSAPYSAYHGTSTGGVAPHQINPGGSTATNANVGSAQQPVNNQGRPMINPPRRAASQQGINLRAAPSATQQPAYVQKMSSQPNLIKPVEHARKSNEYKRKRPTEQEEYQSSSSDDEDLEPGSGQHLQATNGGSKPPARFSGASMAPGRLASLAIHWHHPNFVLQI